MEKILTTIFGNNAILATIFTAMLPLIELKGAIPLGVSPMWETAALTNWQAFAWALLGSSLVVPMIALLFRPIYHWMKNKKFFQVIVDFVVGDVAKRSQQLNAEAQTATARRGLWAKIVAVFLFVAFPVPLTGVWTGTCFAVLLGLNFWVTCVTVIAGNALCGVIVTFVCQVFPQITDILLVVFLVLILAALITKIILHILKKRRAAHAPVDQSQTVAEAAQPSDPTAAQ